MPARSRAAPSAPALTLDFVLFTLHGDRLSVLLAPARRSGRWILPYASLAAGRAPATEAARAAKRVLGHAPAWLAQAGAFADGTDHPAGSALSIAYVGVTPTPPMAPPAGGGWFDAFDPPLLPRRHRAVLAAALTAVRERMDHEPIAFRLLPPAFALGDLQAVYELLLGHRLHKASFRRTLDAAALVKPTKRERSEGRGRPARLFTYAPRKKRGARRGVRLERLGS